MGVMATLQDSDVYVVPGEETTCQVWVCNTGSVVDEFTLDVLGEAKDWTTVSPARVSIFPQQGASVELRFSPPRSPDVPAGDVSFGLRVMSREDTEGSAVEEGAVEIGGYTDPSVELMPRTARGRRKGRFRAVVTNMGNAPLETELFTADPDDKLRFRLKERRLTVEGGTSAIVGLRTLPHKLLFKGAPKSHPFQVMARGDDGETVTADGVMMQYPLLPKSLPKLLALAVAAVAALVILWQLALKPVVKSEAGQAAVQKANQLASSAQQAQQSAQKAQQNAQKAQEKAQKAAGNAEGASQQANGEYPALGGNTGGSGSGQGGSGGSSGPLQASDFRIQTNAPAGTTFKTFAYTVPKNQTLYVSDIYLENPFGDTGVMQVRRNGSVLLEVDLRNFRDLDYHFSQPLQFTTGQHVKLAVQCVKPGTEPTGSAAAACTPAGYFSGRTVVSKS